MDILKNLRRLESKLARAVDEATQRMTLADRRQPLEILHAIVDAAEKRIEPAGRGKYVFPFNQINICIVAGSGETRARFEAVFGSAPSLHDRIVERLLASGCGLTPLSINTAYADRSEPHWTSPEFNIAFDRLADASDPKPQSIVAAQSLRLRVLQGATETSSYVFTESRVNLGRCPEVRDNRNRLIRTNHVIFTESAGQANGSVSRQHAHIDYMETPGEYRLCDDRSALGTSIVRSGKTIAVPPGPRGVRLQSGDEITLGNARLHVEMEIVSVQARRD